jgi:hypothetical protein
LGRILAIICKLLAIGPRQAELITLQELGDILGDEQENMVFATEREFAAYIAGRK